MNLLFSDFRTQNPLREGTFNLTLLIGNNILSENASEVETQGCRLERRPDQDRHRQRRQVQAKEVSARMQKILSR
jgi:hypothetical protein